MDNSEGRITFLNVGTKMLLKDVMDQYVRTLGDFKTHYAPTYSSAVRAFQETTIHLLITEVDLGDGSAFRLVKDVGGAGGPDDDLFVVLALESRSPELMALAEEIEADAVLVKPFSAADLKALVEKYRAWKQIPREPWQMMVQEAQLAAREKKFREAEQNFLEATKVAPNNPVPFYRAGNYYLAKPDHSLAEACFKKALAIKPNYLQALSSLGSLYLAKKDLEKAEETLRKAHELSPLNPDRMVEMVRLYIERATDTCRNALRLDESSTTARYNLGRLMALQKDYIGSVRELERVMPVLRDAMKTEAQTFVALSRKLGGLAK